MWAFLRVAKSPGCQPGFLPNPTLFLEGERAFKQQWRKNHRKGTEQKKEQIHERTSRENTAREVLIGTLSEIFRVSEDETDRSPLT